MVALVDLVICISASPNSVTRPYKQLELSEFSSLIKDKRRSDALYVHEPAVPGIRPRTSNW